MPTIFKGSVVLLNHYLFKLKSASFEKNLPYMYLNSLGHLTVGIGHNIDARGDLLDLPFVTTERFEREAAKDGEKGTPITENKVPNRPATPQEIQNDASFLKEHLDLEDDPPDDLAKYTTLELAPDAIEDLFLTDLNRAYESLLNEFGFGHFLAFPVPCQAGLVDLQFNTGDIRGFPALLRAVKGRGEFAGKPLSERWRAAAAQCNRQVSNERNNTVRQWFTQGATLTPPGAR
jgi:hypothetical protein